MNKWLWLINGAIIFMAILVLFIGLCLMPEYRSLSEPIQQESSVRAKNGHSNNDTTSNSDSPLIAAVRQYSKRWEPPVGSASITITPQQAINDGAQWCIEGGLWKKSGATVNKISAGSHRAMFKSISDWNTPGNLTVNVSRNKTTYTSATYTPLEYGSLIVTISPQEVVDLGGQWRVGNGPWQNSGDMCKVPVGTQRIKLKSVNGWNPPAGLTVKISKDQASTVSASYTKILLPPTPQFGSVTVTIDPNTVITAGAQWRIKDGPWKDSGVTISNIKLGSHTIEFKPVKEWTTPDKITIEVSNGESVQTTATYKPPAPKFILKGTLLIGEDDGLAWINLPKEKKDKAFYIGEIIDNYTLTKIADGNIVLAREGFDYTLKVPPPTPPKKVKSTPKKKPRPKPRRIPSRRRDRRRR